jgi:hypothetical protein
VRLERLHKSKKSTSSGTRTGDLSACSIELQPTTLPRAPSRHQNAVQIHDIKIINRSFKNMAQFKYLETAVTNQNLIQEEMKRRLNSGNACHHSVQNLLSSWLLSKNIKIRI